MTTRRNLFGRGTHPHRARIPTTASSFAVVTPTHNGFTAALTATARKLCKSATLIHIYAPGAENAAAVAGGKGKPKRKSQVAKYKVAQAKIAELQASQNAMQFCLAELKTNTEKGGKTGAGAGNAFGGKNSMTGKR